MCVGIQVVVLRRRNFFLVAIVTVEGSGVVLSVTIVILLLLIVTRLQLLLQVFEGSAVWSGGVDQVRGLVKVILPVVFEHSTTPIDDLLLRAV